jgi:murein DD-endopeptidase MepM/ murein hydrolase activator NlpD
MLILFSACSSSPVKTIKSYQASGVYHRVKSNETLYLIAKAYNVDVQELAEANNIEDPNRIAADSVIFIPDARHVIDDILASANAKRATAGGVPSKADQAASMPKQKTEQAAIQQPLREVTGRSAAAPTQKSTIRIKPTKTFELPPATTHKGKITPKKETPERSFGTVLAAAARREAATTQAAPSADPPKAVHMERDATSAPAPTPAAATAPGVQKPAQATEPPSMLTVRRDAGPAQAISPAIASQEHRPERESLTAQPSRSPTGLPTAEKKPETPATAPSTSAVRRDAISEPSAPPVVASREPLKGHESATASIPRREEERTVRFDRKRFIWPVKGKVVSRFGIQPNGMYYNGIAITTAEHMPVVAAAGGTVIFSGPLKDYGNTIILMHEDHYATVYTHLGQRTVKLDDRVKQSDPIGQMGKSEEKGGAPRLAFEIRYKNKARNPMFFLP